MTSHAASLRGEAVFLGAFLDSALQQVGLLPTGDRLRLILNVHSLFYASFSVMDSIILNNADFRELVTAEDNQPLGYAALLSDKILQPALGFPSFSSRYQQIVASGIVQPDVDSVRDAGARARLLRSKEAFAAFLDGRCHNPMRYDMGAMSNAYAADVLNALDDEEVLRSLRIKSRAADVLRRLQRLRDADPDHQLKRTHFWMIADDFAASNPSLALKLRKFSSVIYHRNAALHLGLTPAFPDSLDAISSTLAAVDESARAIPLNRWTVEQESMTQGSVPFAALATIPYHTIVEFRRQKEFQQYVAGVARARSAPDAETSALEREKALARYLPALTEFALLAVGNQYKEYRKRKRFLRVVRSPVGDVLVTFGGLLLAPAVGLGAELAWLTLKQGIESRIQASITALKGAASDTVTTMKLQDRNEQN